jgi:hypothetical protein
MTASKMIAVLAAGRFHQIAEAQVTAANIQLNEYGTASYVLPEVQVSADYAHTHPTEFPAYCPCCTAPLVTTNGGYQQPRAGGKPQLLMPHARTATYACGAAYTFKSQIQNHTDKWWGTCPRQRRAIDSLMAANGIAAE